MIPSSPSPPTAGRPKRKRNGRPATAGPFRIRLAQAADVAPVAAIERAVFADPWSANDFTECLAAGAPFLVEVGRRARYYRRPVEDAVILRAAIPAAGVSAKL